MLLTAAEAESLRFSTAGVAVNWNAAVGVRMLEEFGPFDEVLAGKNWFNSGVELYLRDVRTVPQIILLRKSYSEVAKQSHLDSVTIISRHVGQPAIIELSKRRQIPVAGF
jgi:hypothetical protein